MEYHCGICLKDFSESDNTIVVVAGDSYDGRLSFFVKVFEKENCPNENIKEFKFGQAVFFTSEKEDIIDLYNIDCLFTLDGKGISLQLEGLIFEYNKFYCNFNVRIFDYKKFNSYDWRDNPKLISDLEIGLMNSLYKGRLYESHIMSIQQITAVNLQNIIHEEEKVISTLDIADLVNELKISYYADISNLKTDKPESYDLYEICSFKSTKYENYNFDFYLLRILNLGEHKVGGSEGWFYADNEANKDVYDHEKNIPLMKKKIQSKYSQSEHLNYRVRDRMAKVIYPLFNMFFIPEKILELNKWNFRWGDFKLFSLGGEKKYVLSSIKSMNERSRNFGNKSIESTIYKTYDRKKMIEDWCMPNPIH